METNLDQQVELGDRGFHAQLVALVAEALVTAHLRLEIGPDHPG
jgi:hypothetical protein